MNLRDLKIPDKTSSLVKTHQDPTAFLSKLPVPIKSPRQTKAKRKVINNIVCSTPINSVKRTIFEDQQISPIRNPSSISLKASSPIKLVNEQELENRLQKNKISKLVDENGPEKVVTFNKKMDESLHHFPLVNNLKICKMILCESDTETLPLKLEKKRGRKGITKINAFATSDNEMKKNSKRSKQPTYSEKIATDSNIRTVLTRSKSETILNEKTDEKTSVRNTSEHKDDENDRDKKKTKSVTKNRNNDSTKSKELKSENVDIEIISKGENKPVVKLKTKINKKIKKNILNGKTKCSINLNSFESMNKGKNEDDLIFPKNTVKYNINIDPIPSPRSNNKARKTKKDVLNDKIADKNEKNLQVLDVSNTTRSTVVIHNSKIEDTKSSENKNSNTNNIVENSNNLNDVKVPELKRRGRNGKSKIADIFENIQLVRKSSRKRVPCLKYWLTKSEHYEPSEQIEKETKKSNSIATAMESREKLKTIKLPATNKKSTRTQEKLKPVVPPTEDKKSSRKPEKIKNDDPPKIEQNKVKQSPSRQSVQDNKKFTVKLAKFNKRKILTAGKIRKSVLKYSTPRNTPKKQTKLYFKEQDDNYTTEEENDIPRDTLLLNTDIEGINKLPSSEKGQKRKNESNMENLSKKIKIQNENEYNFKNMALSADMTPSQAGGLADVQYDGKRCLLGCFGKFPRHYNTNTQNSDISVGVSINNVRITTGVLQIEPAGRKKYEYAKKVDLLFLVLEGTAQIGIGNSSQVLKLGQDFYVPKGTPYYILNVSNTDKLVIYFSKIFK